MGKLNELKTTQDIVLEILKSNSLARNSDSYLCYAVYEYIGRRKGIDINNMSVPMFFLHMKEYGLPSTETIRRTRQKLQASNPELCGCGDVEAQRMMNEDIFKEYALRG